MDGMTEATPSEKGGNVPVAERTSVGGWKPPLLAPPRLEAGATVRRF
jgi:hypothetical protein